MNKNKIISKALQELENKGFMSVDEKMYSEEEVKQVLQSIADKYEKEIIKAWIKGRSELLFNMKNSRKKDEREIAKEIDKFVNYKTKGLKQQLKAKDDDINIAKEMLKKENLNLVKEVAKDSQIANYVKRLKQKDNEIKRLNKFIKEMKKSLFKRKNT